MDCRLEERVALGGAHGLPQVRGVMLAQTHKESAGAGEAHAVAALAEIVREWRDHAEPTTRLAHPVVARGPAGAVVGFLQRPAFVELGAYHRERQVLLEPRALAELAHRHHLDEGEVVPFLATPAH